MKKYANGLPVTKAPYVGLAGQIVKVATVRRFVKKYPDSIRAENVRALFTTAKFYLSTEDGWQRIHDQQQLKGLRLLAKRSRNIGQEILESIIDMRND